METKIGTEVAHVTHDSDTIFKVKRSKVKVTRQLWLAAVVTFSVALLCVVCVFCLLVVLVRLSVPVQVTDWKDSSPK